MTVKTPDGSAQAVAHRPRIVLWLGSKFQPDADLLSNLHRMPLVGVYQETQNAAVEDALRKRMPLNGRFAHGISSFEEVVAWDPETAPVFYLRGREQEPVSSLRDEHRRHSMLERFAVIAARHRPSVIALGMDASNRELETLLSVVAEYGQLAPVLAAGNADALRIAWEHLRESVQIPLVEPQIIDGSWNSLKAYLQEAGISIFLEEIDRPSIRVGNIRVPLDAIWSNPEYRIDNIWRIVTTRALEVVPAAVQFSHLFEAVMRLDEQEDARTADDDFKEWWGISEGVTVERRGQQKTIDAVLSELRNTRSTLRNRSPRICWVAAEAGSGTTILLHTVALHAAREGFPTLIAKQMSRDPMARQLHDFLTGLNQRARSEATSNGLDHQEMPVLLVLDVPQEGVGGMEDLPDELVRVGGRPVVTLRAVRVPPGTHAPGGGIDPGAWLANLLDDGNPHRRLPRKDDPVVSIMRSRPDEEEILLVDEKAKWLSQERNVRLATRTRDTWRRFQEQYGFHVKTLLVNSGLSPGTEEYELALRSFSADELYWLVLHHFLRMTGDDHMADPLACALKRRLGRLPELARREGISHCAAIGLLLEAAKMGLWGIAVPVGALSDHLQLLRARYPDVADSDNSVSNSEDAAAQTSNPRTAEQMRAHLGRLTDWANGRTGTVSWTSGRSPDLDAHRIVDYLSDEDLLRRHSVRGVSYVTVPHPRLAQQILFDALDGTQPVPANQRQAVGGISAILHRDQAFHGLKLLLESLKVTTPNVLLCEDLSSRLLQGEDDSPEWQNGRGEKRLGAYSLIPESIRARSRVLTHHYANVLRRSTFFENLPHQDKMKRLQNSLEQLRHALSLPWAFGERSDSPAFIQTTMGLTMQRLAQVDADNAATWRDSARGAYRAALLDLPSSRHARLALARLCLADAGLYRATASESESESESEKAVGLAAECLRLLSIEPTGQHKKWYEAKHEAARIFGSERGKSFLEELCRRGVEDGYLLRAELMLVDLGHDDTGRIAVADFLEPLVRGDEAPLRPRICRRLAELLVDEPSQANRHEVRYRLLAVVEAVLKRLTPHEEFQLAYLAYQLGKYAEGGKRFALLRSTGRSAQVAGSERPLLLDPDSQQPLDCQARVRSLDGSSGWMRLEARRNGQQLFDAPFTARHFGDDVALHKVYRAIVRLSEKGPRAVPPEFAERGSG